MKKLLLLAFLSSGCIILDPYGYKSSFKWEGVPRPVCSDEVLATVKVLAPCHRGLVENGVVRWYPEPFMCDGRKVWGCSQLTMDYVKASVSLPPVGDATNSALAEELGHWSFSRCGIPNYEHEQGFIDWIKLVNTEARKVCISDAHAQ